MTWENNHNLLSQTIKKSPVLKEIEPLSQDLSALANIGLESFQYLENEHKADSIWVENSLKVIKESRDPRGQTELMIIPAIEKLVKKAGDFEN